MVPEVDVVSEDFVCDVFSVLLLHPAIGRNSILPVRRIRYLFIRAPVKLLGYTAKSCGVFTGSAMVCIRI
jgi:hypothetical protein